MINSFPPILPENPKVLILGSMPGVQSLARYEYYAHPQNQFWKILFRLLEGSDPPMLFDEKIALLHKHQIALWDVLESCEREGSLDSKIKNSKANDLPALLQNHPSIKKILFNGKESHRLFVKNFGDRFPIQMVIMPSTSPAYTLAYLEKLQAWSALLV